MTGARSDTADPASSRIATVHLVYPHGASVGTPDAIGRNLGARLERRYRVEYHDWTARDRITPAPDAALVGHPHPLPGTVFRRSSRAAGWGRVLMLAPFVTTPAQVAFEDGVVRRSDLVLAITGPYWLSVLGASAVAHWAPRMRRLDLAIDRADFPPLKAGFNPPGQRRFAYIGNNAPAKNTPYLSAIAARLPGTDLAWFGTDRRPIEGLRPLGWQDFATPASRALIGTFDFLVTVGRSDANPTTILEAMAWGLIPVCTPQSGYDGVPGIINVPLDDVDGAVAVIERLQGLPDQELRRLQADNWRALDERYTWDRFADAVIDAIEANGRPALGPDSAVRRIHLAWAAITSPETSPLALLPSLARNRLRRWRRIARRVGPSGSAGKG